MKQILFALVVLAPCISHAQVYRCEEPSGARLSSLDNHKVDSDGFKSVRPIVIVEDKEMRIVWGNSSTAGSGSDMVWKAVIIHRNKDSISGVALATDETDQGSAAMLYTLNTRHGYLYYSGHKNVTFPSSSFAATYAAKCTVSK